MGGREVVIFYLVAQFLSVEDKFGTVRCALSALRIVVFSFVGSSSSSTATLTSPGYISFIGKSVPLTVATKSRGPRCFRTRSESLGSQRITAKIQGQGGEWGDWHRSEGKMTIYQEANQQLSDSRCSVPQTGERAEWCAELWFAHDA